MHMGKDWREEQMMEEIVRSIVVSMLICACGCAHERVCYTAVDAPSMKTLYQVTSDLDTRGPSLLNKDDKAHVFYTRETTMDQTRTYIRCYDYGSGYNWEGEIPLIVGHYSIWCVGKEVYVGGNGNVWRGKYPATDLYGCVVMFNLEVPHPKLEVVVPSERRDVCCREIAAYNDKFLAFLFGPDNCGEEFSSYVIFDPFRHQVVEKKCFTDDESRFRILARCTRSGKAFVARHNTAFGKFAKKVTTEGCVFYDDHFRLVSKLPADTIEKQFLLLGSQNEEFVRRSRAGKYFADTIRDYNSEFVADGRCVFWNIYGSWFVYDINALEIVDSGMVNLDANELLNEFVDLNCLLVHIRRSRLSQFLTWDFREDVYELIFIENGKQRRKRIPGLKRVRKLTDGIYCLDFQG